MSDTSERCPLCAGYGVVSRQVGRLVAPNVREYETRDIPCPHCAVSKVTVYPYQSAA